ncbi:MAG: glycerol-3-phosphate acyltransferase [Planctomycetes bacterium]|nr:glycerol-3-phosphate acyltransferase [Planctomycetota bacterium]
MPPLESYDARGTLAKAEAAMIGPGLYLVASFAVGGIPFALLLGLLRGVDIRTRGSGNVGATNLGRSLGLTWGILALVLDAAKGVVAVALVPTCLGPTSPAVPVLAGAAAIVGHCFSPYLGFRGGKGVATAAGVLLGLNPLLFGVILLLWGVGYAITRTVGIASSIAAAAAMVIGLLAAFEVVPRLLGTSVAEGWFAALLGVLVLVRHRSNLTHYIRSRARGAP